jgi:hypothetical protein
LTKYGDVIGKLKCKFGATCGVKTVEMDERGFIGTYNEPSVIREKKARRRLAANGHENPYNLTHHEVRRLAVLEVEGAVGGILNPIYCITTGDSMIFNIKNAEKYPVYMDDSVMNTNPAFDTGSFIDLAVEMNRKKGAGDTTETLFSFTFVDPGTYVFHASNNRKKIMIVTAKGKGEECADPDRYV